MAPKDSTDLIGGKMANTFLDMGPTGQSDSGFPFTVLNVLND